MNSLKDQKIIELTQELSAANKGNRNLSKEIDHLKQRIEVLLKECNHWRGLAENWMLDYDKLKNRYEP